MFTTEISGSWVRGQRDGVIPPGDSATPERSRYRLDRSTVATAPLSSRDKSSVSAGITPVRVGSCGACQQGGHQLLCQLPGAQVPLISDCYSFFRPQGIGAGDRLQIRLPEIEVIGPPPLRHIGPSQSQRRQKDGAHRHGDQAFFSCRASSLPGPADGEHRAAAGPVGRLHRAAPLGHRVADDGQSQARAAGGPGAALSTRLKSLKQPRQILRRDPGAVVLHCQHHLLPPAGKGELDRAAGRAYLTALSVRL